MFTRTELESKTLLELRDMCLAQYGLKPMGNLALKEAYINALLSFTAIACLQLREDAGFKTPTAAQVETLKAMIDQIGTPTIEQSALIKVTLEGRRAEYPLRYDQEKLFVLYRVKWYLDTITQLLEML